LKAIGTPDLFELPSLTTEMYQIATKKQFKVEKNRQQKRQFSSQ
jgi:hypothetical protein